MFPMIDDQQGATLDCHCRVGEKYPSHRAHLEQAQERTRLEAVVESVESELG